MKILHVVTYISPDGSYGGPVRVALNQAKALQLLGHEVVVAAAAGGFHGPLPTEFDSFPVHLFKGRRLLPGAGFAGLISPSMLAWLAKSANDADVIHVHLARDLVTIPAAIMALRAGRPLIVQPHGMIDRTNNPLAVPLDAVLTRRILRAAAGVLYLTERERCDLIEVAGKSLQLVQLANGVPTVDELSIEQQKGVQTGPEVLFMSRLQERKRPLLMVSAAQALHDRHPNAAFTLVGPDEGQGSAVRSAIKHVGPEKKVQWCGSISPDKTLDRMRQASIFALPSTDEPFPMAVLEAMSIGLPVVITRSCGIARDVVEGGAGIVCDESPESFIDAIDFLLTNAQERINRGRQAKALALDRFSLVSVAKALNHIYERPHH